ncbi:MAG: DUF4003 family protein [Lachnospiraceae bacterium]|nr:DUF4003 family protein [Lachnospiraceae bacterium]
MKDLLQAGCELLADNKDLIRKSFAWDLELMSVAGSVIFTGAGKAADIEKMKECKSILKKHKGIFSEFRSNMEIPVICKMALAEDPEKYLMDVTVVYDKLSKGKIFGSEHLVMTALAICDEEMAYNVDAIVEKTKLLMKRMSSIHPWLTSEEDTALVALLALTNKSVDQIVEETELCYNLMKQKFSFHNNAVQSLSHVLALCAGDPMEKCARASAIYDALLVKGIKYGLDYELASLGALVNVDLTPEELADEIAAASDYLRTRKGFGDWGMGSKARVMFAALMTVQAYAPSSTAMDTSVLSSALAAVIAEEICFMIIMASVAASSSN